MHGDIEAETPVHIHGTINGNINCTSKLVIGKSGIINGNIVANELSTDGFINGDAYITFDARVGKEAVINGKIDASPLLLHKDAIIPPLEYVPEKDEVSELLNNSNAVSVKKSKEIARWF
jgi:cytoskeletal protein CcmA (bactofilin family)